MIPCVLHRCAGKRFALRRLVCAVAHPEPHVATSGPWMSQEDEELHEEVLLADEESAGPAAARPAPAGSGPSDPLTLASATDAAAGYRDMYAARQQHAAPAATQPASVGARGAHGVPAASSGAGSSNDSALPVQPEHRASASLTLDSLDIGPEDNGFLQGGGGAGGAGPSTRPAPQLQVSVSDPVRRVGDSVIPGFTSTHFEYLVTTVFESPRRRVEVRRRFKDFVVSNGGGDGGGSVKTNQGHTWPGAVT